MGCNTAEKLDAEVIKELQVEALKEYLQDNAVLADPIIIDNIISDNLDEYRGIVKFKIPGTKRTQKVLCTGVLYNSEIKLSPFGEIKQLSIICGS